MDIEEFEYDDNESFIFDKNEEWLKYLRDCDEYNEKYEECIDLYSFNNAKPKPEAFLIDQSNVDKDSQYEMFILGRIKAPICKKKSFKYTNIKSNIFCTSLLTNKKCTTNCKYVHNFQDIPFCHGKCSKITINYEFFYTGTCTKRHVNETLDNYVFRKSVKLLKNNLTFSFFEKPNIEHVSEILKVCKKLGYLNVTFTIKSRQKTIDDFYSTKM